jgi:hypothetical protein
MKNYILSISLALTAVAAAAQTAPAAVAAKTPDRTVRTLSVGDIPMLDDVSITLLTGGTAEQALQVRQASMYVDKGFWAQGTVIGDASIRGFRRMSLADVQRRAQLVQQTARFFLPVALSQVYMDASGAQAQFPIAIDSERFNVQAQNASVCAFGRQACLVLDNVNLSQTIHRNNPGRPVMALKTQTTLLTKEAMPVYGLIVDVKPGVRKVDGRSVVVASALRGGFIDLTQCTHSVACGVAFEFELSNGAGVAGFAK